MAKLSSKTRNALPAKDFAGPNRSFPVENKAHAVAAERMLPRAMKAGSVTPAQAGKIKAKAEKVAGNKSPVAPKAKSEVAPGDFEHGGMMHHSSMKPYVDKGQKC